MALRARLLLPLLVACHNKGDDSEPKDTGEPWRSDWALPACDTVSGLPGLSWTSDAGQTAAPRDSDPEVNTYTDSVLTLAEPGAMLASHDGALYRSWDAGCTWTGQPFPDGLDHNLVTGASDRAYGWSQSVENLIRIDGDTQTELPIPADELAGLAVDQDDDLHLRAGDDGCSIYESFDGGSSWNLLFAAPTDLTAHAVAFDPQDLDHVVCAIIREGAWVSFDGGERWAQGHGLELDGTINMFTALITSGDKPVVWGQGLILDSGTRVIWRSEDGGTSWDRIISEDEGVSMTNGVPMAVHPGVPYTVAWASQEELFTYNTQSGLVSRHTPVADMEVQAVAASPAEPGTWYLGLGIVENY